MNYLEVPLVSHSVTSDVKTAFFKKGDRYFLTVVNNGTEDKTGTIYFPAIAKLRGKMRVKDLMPGKSEVYNHERREPFTVELARKDGKIIEFKPL